VVIDGLKNRKEVYELAKQKHPERLSRETRDWSVHESVALNPMKESNEKNRMT
jgi:putative transposase